MSSASEVLAYVAARDSALLPCLPARELQAADRASHPSLHVDVERHTKDFMEAANKLQLFFLRVGHQSQPSAKQVLRQQVAALETEIAEKDKLLERHVLLVQKCQQVLTAHSASCITELQTV
ncbi:hypothetical protein R1flu_015544 [Riccia fluitans]|uniref:Mediator of RNA polymerase II transcription subunit 28 n=1 Tax=Riccia fluitans TaxID=41844 RepID=A0ABD1YJ85_9MARC